MTDKFKALRELIRCEETTFIMEAHDGVSARIVEHTGFKAIWASGLSISTSLGLRDCSEVSWTEVARTAQYMADVTNVPILLDGDSGFGNFNAVRQLVRKLCQIDVAGVCIEDALFPKQNSFLGDNHPLVSIEEFCGKIRAAKDAQLRSEFTVVARVEALVSGRPLSEALDRANAYREAGADAILIHSKKKDAKEILEFCAHWERRAPLIIVPTKYFGTPTEAFRRAGVSSIIWANHNLRAAMKSMRHISRTVFERESVADIESEIESLDSLFSLLDYSELETAEQRYVPRVVYPSAIKPERKVIASTEV